MESGDSLRVSFLITIPLIEWQRAAETASTIPNDIGTTPGCIITNIPKKPTAIAIILRTFTTSFKKIIADREVYLKEFSGER